ncbi:hypothetical protein GPECTOR_81g181 [Gonium pectorale]|uniref:Uncharacterized protein n=1 Tax=Gonium pectorale TaxID=33097 RepID=A0A150G1J0_GONPE|nr:hypothetical protein GPECTOR_81g181 [Gonium pectorale]|eukprot:KXZ43733.1 hypothetical protein GPECTOR_81g181 [Gonium pectorale]
MRYLAANGLAAAALLAVLAFSAPAEASRRQLITLYMVQSGTLRQTTNEGTLNSVNTPLGYTLCMQKMSQMNISAFTGTFDLDTGKVIYDLNDFDESFVANFLYDVYRFATSIFLVGRENGMSDTNIYTCVRSFVNFYCDRVKDIANGVISDSFVWSSSNAYGRIDNLIIDAETNESRKKMLDKWTVINATTSTRKFMSNAVNPDLDAVNTTERSAIIAAMPAYYTNTITSTSFTNKAAYFKVLDVAKRLNAGTGSLGTPRYYVLVDGASTGTSDDRILDVKLQGKPTVYAYLSSTAKAAVDNAVANNAERAVKAYKKLINQADNHLGWMTFLSGNYSVRERSPFKASLDTAGVDLSSLTNLAEQWGVMLAGAHARSDGGSFGTPTSFETVVKNLVAGNQDLFKTEVADFAQRYANQVNEDFSIFRTSLAAGKLCI